MPGPAQRAGAAASGAKEDAAAAATMDRRGTAESAGRHSVLQIFPPSVEFRNVEIGKTYTATLKVKVRLPSDAARGDAAAAHRHAPARSPRPPRARQRQLRPGRR